MKIKTLAETFLSDPNQEASKFFKFLDERIDSFIARLNSTYTIEARYLSEVINNANHIHSDLVTLIDIMLALDSVDDKHNYGAENICLIVITNGLITMSIQEASLDNLTNFSGSNLEDLDDKCVDSVISNQEAILNDIIFNQYKPDESMRDKFELAIKVQCRNSKEAEVVKYINLLNDAFVISIYRKAKISRNLNPIESDEFVNTILEHAKLKSDKDVIEPVLRAYIE